MTVKKQEIILGIDPGFGRVGWGVVEQNKKNEWRAIAYGCIETSTKKTFVARLAEIHDDLIGVIKKYQRARGAKILTIT